jgi:NAD-dependent SIR2 family protein deacetylase
VDQKLPQEHAAAGLRQRSTDVTYTHRALAALERAGHVYYCVTQNYDDLSRQSRFPRKKLSELRGNIFVENCDCCGHEYHRDFEVILDDSVNHETGRTCKHDGCTGALRDNIVHFDEMLPWHELKMANAKFVGADLTIVLGSSLRVDPAASMPFKSKRRHCNPNTAPPKSVIVNLQETYNSTISSTVVSE